MMRIVRAATKRAKRTMTTTAMSAAMGAYSFRSSFGDHRGGAADLHHVDAGAGLDDILIIVGPRRPDLALQPHGSGAFEVGDALQHDGRAPDERRGAGTQPGGRAQVTPRDRA